MVQPPSEKCLMQSQRQSSINGVTGDDLTSGAGEKTEHNHDNFAFLAPISPLWHQPADRKLILRTRFDGVHVFVLVRSSKR